MQDQTPLLALSPLDGRYAPKLAALRALMSEQAYMRFRVQAEVVWFIALSEAGLEEFPPLSAPARAAMHALVSEFDSACAQRVKQIEQTTRHDVKAVEYWIKERMAQHPELAPRAEFVHFACTSEDINNLSHALQIQAARAQVLLPALDSLCASLRQMAHDYAGVAMLSRTHGQSATPTTVGKEFANVVARLGRARATLAELPLLGKLNGAVGNYNAHSVAAPQVDWPALAQRVVQSPPPVGLGLVFQDYSTQIEPHDYMAAIFDALARTNTILLDLARDCWGYISWGYFKQRTQAGEVGSSTMPHKVNPIDFENAEGNLGLANALLRHFSEKLPISRFQRDLSDSTVLRNVGVAFGHSLLAYQALQAGLGKLELNAAALGADLDNAWEVLAEPIQTVMRRAGLSGAYEQLKALTRGRAVGAQELRDLVDQLKLPETDKQRLRALTPATYTGLAEQLARAV